MTPLHRAAYLAQHDGYLELYEYLLVRLSVLPSAWADLLVCADCCQIPDRKLSCF